MSLPKNICLALGCVVLTASACLAINPPRSHNGKDQPQDYRGWMEATIPQIDSDDANQQRKAVGMLSITIVDPAVRQKVLAALEPHLNGTDQYLRLLSITAFGHWATKDQIKQLQQVVATNSSEKSPGESSRCWAQAIVEMISLDPDAAKSAMEQRMGDFFFKNALVTLLTTITVDNNSSQPAEFAMLKQCDPSDPFVMSSTLDAITLVRSDSAQNRSKGADVLAHAVVVADERSEVLESLRPHIAKVDQSAFPFIQAYSHWANEADIGTLKKIIATDPADDDRGNGAINCWTAALMGLARMNPQAAAEAAKSRADVTFFPFLTHHLFEPIAQGNSDDSSTACWLIGMLDTRDGEPRIPSGFNPTVQKSVVPVAPRN